MLRGRSLKLVFLLLAALTFVLVAASCGGDDDEEGGGEGGTLVYGTPADPTALDGALISDGESIRVLYQITEGLTALKPGTSEIVPSLATEWETSADGLAWTFTLREGVTFHDGTDFNAEAVCFNFNRWFNFPEAFQGDGTTYYWKYGFGGGFAKPAEGNPGPKESLYKSCEAVDESTVTLNLNKPSSTVLSTLTLPSIHIVEPEGAPGLQRRPGPVDADGLFEPTGRTPHSTRPVPDRSSSRSGGSATS